MKNLPTIFQQRMMWSALTAVSMTLIGAISIGLIFLATRIIAFLQPILIPFAVAGVLAYLLDPLVCWLVRLGLTRHRAVVLVFSAVTIVFIGVLVGIIPKVQTEGPQFARDVISYSAKVRGNLENFVNDWHTRIKDKYGIEVFDLVKPSGEGKPAKPASTAPASTENTDGVGSDATPPSQAGSDPAAASDQPDDFELNDLLTGAWIKDAFTRMVPAAWNIVRSSVGGFLGVFGFLLSFVIVPLYLYYFLTESAVISERWSDYLPIRASEFKDEVVDTLTEINGYLIAFFRGQLVVSMINGVATGIGLTLVGLKFGWLIGLLLCLLGIIPYLGIITCWIPAVIIASVQGGSWLIPADASAWIFPAVVTAIFVVVQQIDGLFITPKVVGESVGLHPMTVIVSVFVWSLILGGLLGAILAVPMTAAVKVLFQRYVWRARLAPQTIGGAARLAREQQQPAAQAESTDEQAAS